MRMRTFGSLGDVSALTLGGGGIGRVWGPTDENEAIATVNAAVTAGITLFDVAPSYGTEAAPREAERVIGEAFGGKRPPGVRIVTKVQVDDAEPAAMRETIRKSLEESLRVMRFEYVDLYLHHSDLRPDRLPPAVSTLSLRLYREVLRPEFERLREEGLIGAWGLTATGHPEAVSSAMAERPLPQAIQAVTNLLDSSGSLWNFDASERPDNSGTRNRAAAAGVGVMGIRSVQGGALTDALDRDLPEEPERRDYQRSVGFRALAARRGESAAFLAHRYALSLQNVDTVVLGVKNRTELAECVAAEAAGPLSKPEMAEIRESVGRT
jgi:aryl-alcohol dehydrogenase-like predicted oxidoreductase